MMLHFVRAARAAVVLAAALAVIVPATVPARSAELAKNLFGSQKLPAAIAAEILWLLLEGLFFRRRRHRHRRPDLAGHAAVAQPALGPSGR